MDERTRSWVKRLIVGLVIGLVIGSVGSILMVPLGQPDAAEIPFGLGLLISVGALLVAIATWWTRPRVAGLSLGLIGGWLIFWFLIVQLPPFNTM